MRCLILIPKNSFQNHPNTEPRKNRSVFKLSSWNFNTWLYFQKKKKGGCAGDIATFLLKFLFIT